MSITGNQRQAANAVRVLSMDAVERAQSGHPGAPMGMADIICVLWHEFLRHNPANPDWCNRDRFVMSNGHGSMLLYAALHLSGYDVSIEDIKAFRQLNSSTPGHPEYGCTPGIETTTGPLGQGLANAVGMALAESVLAAQFNRPDLPLVDHHTYVSVGDGCLMEGISHEACSLAGTLKLGKLIGLYDSNGISIDGDVNGWFTEDVVQRFQAYGWQVIAAVDGHDAEQIRCALKQAITNTTQPSLICFQTTIGCGSPNKQGTAAVHGAPLGKEECEAVRKNLAWEQPPFVVPRECYTFWDSRESGNRYEQEWQQCWQNYQQQFPQLADEFSRRQQGQLPATWQTVVRKHITTTAEQAQDIATRKASLHSLNAYSAVLPELFGGSADLTGSNLTLHQNSEPVSATRMEGNYLYYGVREFAMAAINNGIALHKGFIPYAGTFLIFSDYARNALRMAALMGLRSVYVFTHDSIGLGEDGPTHQAVEQAATLRLLPNMTVWRPADAVETAVAWQYAIEHEGGPVALLLSRQSLPALARTAGQVAAIKQGAYILEQEDGDSPELLLIATGSELALARAVVLRLQAEGVQARLVAMPCCEVFESQTQEYREQIIPPLCRKRIAVEAGIGDYWRKYVGLDGDILGVEHFGESAPAKDVFLHFGFSEDNLLLRCRRLLA